ncbi:MAG: hypothetical protein ABIQ60_08210 [Burkholderiaceae bacterium]
MNRQFFRPLGVVLLALPAASMAQIVDFAQLDRSSSSTTLVLARELPRTGTSAPAPLLSATATRWSTGEAAALGWVYRWSIADGTHRWLAGAGAGANTFRTRAANDASNESALSGRLQLEWSGPAPGGSYYALAQASSFRGAWFAVLQYSPSAQPIGFEWSRYHETTYQATSVALQMATGVPNWFVRLGAVHAEGRTRPFIGVTYNGF